MRHKALRETLRKITKVQLNPRVEPGQGDRLQKVKRELEAMSHSGKFDKQQIYKIVETIATIALETLDTTQC